MFLFVVMLGLCFFSKESSQSFLGRPQLTGPSEAEVKKYAGFSCELQVYPKNETILLQLYKEGNRDKLLAEYSLLSGRKLDEGEVSNFPLVVQLSYEGYLECVASAQNNSNIEPTVSNKHHLKVIEPVKDAKVNVSSGPREFFEGRTLNLHCELSAGNHVSYKWLLNDRPVAVSPAHHFRDNHLRIYRPTSADSGSYMCVATNSFNQTVYTSNSSKVVITVKDVVSTPDISFTVLKEDSHNYSAVVTCQSTRGTPPVTFSLYNLEDLVANVTVEERSAVFKIPVVLNRHLGWLQCQADNGDWVAKSQFLPLEVVPVGGPVTISSDIHLGENYAVIALEFHCQAAKGTHPQYQWFLNKTLLHDRGSFYYVSHDPPRQSVLMLSVGRDSNGTYHCEVSDNFDNTTAISSKRHYVDKEELNRIPDFVVAIVFGCFTLLILVVSACCWIGVLIKRREYGERSLADQEMRRMVAVYENDLDLLEYNEDADVARTARDGEFDQVSDVSVDECSQYGEEEEVKEP
ncbi:Fc receptor-like protein 5 [Scomber scombrus]|uniref:Fc receptor-like protein 5 n=1 Tax=Scomber scombrus TaxID=13677 RepID=UPI002DDC74EC|nr:Fc receptor-like protein 5 [Scomber scombrus]